MVGCAVTCNKGVGMLNQLTDQDIKEIGAAATFQELGAIALKALERFGTATMVCGPITTGGTGSKEKNLEIFQTTIAFLDKSGFMIFSQMPFEEALWRIKDSPEYREPADLMNGFYLPLLRSGLVTTLFFIPGWEQSFGANWEHRMATELGIRIVYLKKVQP